MKIVTAQQMREIDRQTVEQTGIPYAILMETAGAKVVEAIIDEYGSVEDKWISVYCGKGNNGGDGAVIARLLWLKKAFYVEVFLFGSIAETKGEARANFEIIRKLQAINEAGNRSARTIRLTEISEQMDESESYGFGSDFIVDALLGTGISRPVEGLFASAIHNINFHFDTAPIIAVDIPSGLSSDAEQIIGAHVKAKLTVSFTAPKPGNIFNPAAAANGKLIVAPIGTPDSLLREINLALIEESQITQYLQDSARQADAHKGSVGNVLLIAGSRGKTGAAALTSEAILRAGAGLVTVATSTSARALLVTQACAEMMTEALAETDSGAISEAALKTALQIASNRTVVAIGPGLSSSDESTRKFVLAFVQRRTCPMVIDADGLNALAPWPEELKGSTELPIIITPHPGEMARLTGKTNAEIGADRIGVAREFATKNQVITVVKGSRTIIAAPTGEVFVNPTGNAGMATAGSGDVLTGLISGLLAQAPQTTLEATIAGVYLHGLAGDFAVKNLGQRSLIASDIINHLHQAFLHFE